MELKTKLLFQVKPVQISDKLCEFIFLGKRDVNVKVDVRKGKKNKNLPAAPKAPASPEAPQDSALESKKDSDYADYDKGDDLKH